MLIPFVVLRPARALQRLGILSGVASIGLLVTNHHRASGVALCTALLLIVTAVVTWVVQTFGEVLLFLVGLGAVLRRAVRYALRVGRTRGLRLRTLVWIELVLAFVAIPVGTNGQLPVIDAANLVQTTLTALKAVESVTNEVQMLANQVKQVENMLQNTRTYGNGIWDTQALPRLLQLGQVIDQEQAIAYSMANVDSLFRQRYPGYQRVTDWSTAYDTWTRTTLDTLRGALNALGLHGEDFATEQNRIRTLQALSDSAAGRMQALQVGNMMAAEQLQQLVKLRQLVMAQINAQTVYMATQTNRDAQRAATQSQWIRNGNADAPPLAATTSGVSSVFTPGH